MNKILLLVFIIFTVLFYVILPIDNYVNYVNYAPIEKTKYIHNNIEDYKKNIKPYNDYIHNNLQIYNTNSIDNLFIL